MLHIAVCDDDIKMLGEVKQIIPQNSLNVNSKSLFSTLHIIHL